MAVEIVTGHSGTNHIDADDVRNLLYALTTYGHCLLQTGVDATINPASTVIVPALDLLLLSNSDDIKIGHCRLDGTDSVTISATSIGYYRKDYIALQYFIEDTIESGEIIIVQGTPATTESGAVLPTLTNTSTLKQVGLYQVNVHESTVSSIKFLLETLFSLGDAKYKTTQLKEELESDVEDLNTSITNAKTILRNEITDSIDEAKTALEEEFSDAVSEMSTSILNSVDLKIDNKKPSIGHYEADKNYSIDSNDYTSIPVSVGSKITGWLRYIMSEGIYNGTGGSGESNCVIYRDSKMGQELGSSTSVNVLVKNTGSSSASVRAWVNIIKIPE